MFYNGILMETIGIYVTFLLSFYSFFSRINRSVVIIIIIIVFLILFNRTVIQIMHILQMVCKHMSRTVVNHDACCVFI